MVFVMSWFCQFAVNCAASNVRGHGGMSAIVFVRTNPGRLTSDVNFFTGLRNLWVTMIVTAFLQLKLSGWPARVYSWKVLCMGERTMGVCISLNPDGSMTEQAETAICSSYSSCMVASIYKTKVRKGKTV